VVATGGTVGLVTVAVLAGCCTGVGGGCTARYILVGPNTPCLPDDACAIKQLEVTQFCKEFNNSIIYVDNQHSIIFHDIHDTSLYKFYLS
jgi:hypothetical protein